MFLIQSNRAGAPELGILPGAGAGAQIKNKEPEQELSLKFRTGAGVVAI